MLVKREQKTYCTHQEGKKEAKGMVVNLLLLLFISGLFLGSALPTLPSLGCVGLILVVCLLLLLLYIRFAWRRYLYVIALALGFLWSVFYGHQLFAQRLPDAFASQDFLVEGTVINLPEQTERGERFDLAVEQVLRTPLSIPGDFNLEKLRLNSYQITSQHEFQFQPGQRWRLWVRLKPPRGMVNPYGFDYEGWLLQEGYSAVGYVRSSTENTQLPEPPFAFNTLAVKTLFDHWGFASLQWINTHVDSLDQRALFAAIALGYKEEFTRHHWDLLKNTGTIHLVVVSGLNIVLAASVGYFLLAGLSRLLFFPLHLLPAPVWGAMGAIALAVFYAGMTGLSLPTQRSLVMVLCGLMTLLLRRQMSVATGFLIALAAVLVLDPLAGFTASLWLSFGAVAILLYGFSSRIFVNRKKFDLVFFLKQWIYTQWFVSLGIFPLLAYWMGSVPLVMPLANLFAVPFATFVLLPLTIFSGLAFAISPTIGNVALVACGKGMDIFWSFLKIMEPLNVNWYMTMGNPERGDVSSLLVLGFALLAVLILLAPRAVVPRYYGLLLLLPLLFPLHNKLVQGEFELTQIDVGQGLSVLIETRNGITVYDVGDHYSDQFDIGRDVAAQLIRRKGYKSINTLIISHSDSDHAGGLKGLLGELPVARLLSGNADIIQSRLRDNTETPTEMNVESCLAGQSWTSDGVLFELLSPTQESPSTKRNNQSCVVKISNSYYSMLLTGDIESDREFSLLSEADRLKANVLIVPHHGSKSSSTMSFLQAINPDLALVSVGYKSQYGHPHPEVLERYRQLGIPLLRSDQSGAITIGSRLGDQPRMSRLTGLGYWRRW